MITVSWIAMHSEVKARGMWDQTIVERLLEATGLDLHHQETWGGDVVIFGGRHHVDHVEAINERLNRRAAVVVIVTSDEEGEFPWWELSHPNMRLWVQTPRRGHERVLGVGPSPHTPWYGQRDLVWGFAGQVTHRRRKALAETLRMRGDGLLVESEGFTEGLPPDDYMRMLSRVKVAPCPAGPVTPDTFRLYEAIESGCMPVVDRTSDSDEEYWQRLYREFPVPSTDDWATVDFDGLAEGWPANANLVSSWWSQWQHEASLRLREDITALSGATADPFTVVISTSPIPSHPNPRIMSETIRSIRERTNARIVVMADGVRAEQEHLRDAYESYLHRLLWESHQDPRMTVIRYGVHLHQAEMLRRTLPRLDTASVLFCEHDTPLEGDIPLTELAEVTASGAVNLIRLHHEASILADHEHLMGLPVTFGELALRQTVQWSQRPHMANRVAYQSWLAEWFRPGARTMIEDRMHGVVQSHEWGRFRLAMFTPPGNVKRSGHLDGRESEPKFEMEW